MPMTVPTGMQAWLKNQGTIAMVVLLDIETADGTRYFWSDCEGNYFSIMTGAQQFYNGWVKSAGPFTFARDLSTNAGDLVIQNLSGNSIDRDIDSALGDHEFEGALCIARLWLPLFDGSLEEFHGSLSEQDIAEDELSLRLLALFDTSQYDVAEAIISESCGFRYKSAQCGSAGAAATCDFAFTTCQDANHAAQERFDGVLTIVPNAGVFTPPTGPGGGGGGDRGGDGGGDDGGRPGWRPLRD